MIPIVLGLLVLAGFIALAVLSPKQKQRPKQLPRRGGGVVVRGGGGSSRRHVHVSDDSADQVADRLFRAADRYENAGDHERAERARHAASNLRDADDLGEAHRVEQDILGPDTSDSDGSSYSGHGGESGGGGSTADYSDNS
jgi:hypothetical protein